MKKIFKPLVAVLSLGLTLLAVSCTDGFEDANINGNAPGMTDISSNGLFNNANKALINASRGDFSSGRIALPWVQYSAQRNYTEEDRFQYRVGTGNSFYLDHYLIAQDYRTILDLNTNPATVGQTSAYGNTQNQIAAARIMLAYTFCELTDTFGDIPYYSYGNSDPDFQALALDGKILKPKFATQEKIYTDLMKELKEASAMIVLGQPVFIKGDLLFGNNAAKMQIFANSLRLRIANRVKSVIPAAAVHITEAIAAGVMTSNADNVGLKFENTDVYPSPMYVSHFVRNRDDFGVSNTFVDLLKGTRGNFPVDPRLQKYAAPISADLLDIRDKTYVETADLSQYIGMPYGITTSDAESQRPNTSFFSYNILKKDYTEILMEYSEVEFLLSENAGWNDVNYKAGVRASMEKWGVDNAAITAYIAALPAASQANVMNQKYIALFMQPYEAWAEYRRTGFPDTLLKPNQTYTTNNLFPTPNGTFIYTFEALNGLIDLPTRLQYPTNSAQLNGVNYAAAVTSMGGPDNLTTKLIWDNN
ncbi:SusD/RagB family nutrient-binding outer membrane lipoprotein [Flavobacterium ardleyense]|uniref:SusD/RagB family nutrient-binding outer membrane lipoprotein n=1 Tax=Flavobacterium ardleyense TaxID=2038737 RepID=A0ABW5ZAV4_9FLAO